MADIAGLVKASHLLILRWQAAVGQLRTQSRRPGSSRRELAGAWGVTARLIDWHMSAGEEICGPATWGLSDHGLRRLEHARDEHAFIREILAEACLQPPGSPLWWRLAGTALSGWTGLATREEHNLVADLRRLDPGGRPR